MKIVCLLRNHVWEVISPKLIASYNVFLTLIEVKYFSYTYKIARLMLCVCNNLNLNRFSHNTALILTHLKKNYFRENPSYTIRFLLQFNYNLKMNGSNLNLSFSIGKAYHSSNIIGFLLWVYPRRFVFVQIVKKRFHLSLSNS